MQAILKAGSPFGLMMVSRWEMVVRQDQESHKLQQK